MSRKIIALLDEYADVYSKLDEVKKETERVLKSIIPEDIKNAIDDVNTEFSSYEGVAQQKISEIKEKIVALMVSLPPEEYKTIKGGKYMVVAKGGKEQIKYDAALLVEGLRLIAEDYPDTKNVVDEILADAKKSEITNRSPVIQVVRGQG